MQVFRVIKKFNRIISRHQKLRVAELLVLMIFGGLLETLSISLILPFMNIVLNPEQVMSKDYVVLICRALGIESSKQFLIVIAIVLACTFILKNIYLLFEYNVQYRFVYGNMVQMQERLLANFIYRPYEFFLKSNSADIIRIINSDTGYTFSLLSTLLQLFTELVVSSMLIIAVFLIAPGVTIVMAIVLLLLLAFINHFLKPILKHAGKKTQESSSGMNKWLIQSIDGAKEIKATCKEEFFLHKFNENCSEYVKALRKNYILGLTPRFTIEAVSMSTMFVVVAIMIYCGDSLEFLVPIISAVALAAIRLLPSVNRISSSLASISYSEPMLDKLIESLRDINGKREVSLNINVERPKEAKKSICEIHHDISFNSITFKYPEGDENVLESVNLTIKKGTTVGIVGTSGAGKSTLVDLMLGILTPIDGEIKVDGVNIREDIRGYLRRVGYIPQSIFMMDDSIKNNVAFGEEILSEDDVWRALKQASLYDFVKELPKGLDTSIGERGVRLSGGQRQRIGIARALFNDPEILVFDEATSALDNDTERSIIESINSLRGEKTIIIIAHRLTTIEHCDEVYRVNNKKVIKEK